MWGAQMSFIDQFSMKVGRTTSSKLSDLQPIKTEKRGALGMLPKRMLDILIAVTLIVILAPLMVLITLAIKRSDGGNAIFTQRRIGRDAIEFDCLKFRTMVLNAPEKLAHILATDPAAAQEWERYQKLKNDPRITKFGKFLRKTSLDELPQLWNILKGEMSVVGPRPIVEEEVSKYGRYFSAYTSVTPGVTGMWQISGRNDTTYDERVQMDVQYAETQSIWLDLKILFFTIPAVLFSKGAY